MTWQLSFISLYSHIPEISVHLLLQMFVTVQSFKAHQPYNQIQRTQTCLCDVDILQGTPLQPYSVTSQMSANEMKPSELIK
jgi:hypothetical protein